MLRLVSTQKSGVSYPLLVDVTYTVGRKQGDITFPDDQSVSRVHAEVVVEHPAGNVNEPLLTPVLTLTDVGSKFGTFATEDNINSKTNVNARERVTISVGEKIRFGLQWNEYKVDYTPFVITSSSFKATPDFRAKIVKLGGHYVNEWNSYVTHVVMESLTLTVKAVCALLAAKPIVTPAYVSDIVSAFETRKPQLDIKGYLPPIGEKGMADLSESHFLPKAARTTLFAGKIFLFCTTKHLKKIAVAIEAGGGTAKLITDVVGANILSNEYIIMGHPLDVADGEKDGRIKATLDAYRKGGKRLIPDSEIGLAAVYSSIEKHCNPKSSITSAVLPHITTQTQSSTGSSSSAHLVPETQDVITVGNGDASINTVNETVVKQEDELNADSRGEKRRVEDSGSSSKKRSASGELSGPGKRMKGSSLSLSRSSKSSSQKTNSKLALSTLFNFSSSDDDDDEMVSVPETQPQPNASIEDEVEVVPDSQNPQVHVVDVRNLQSIASTQESLTGQAGNKTFRVPASPPLDEPSQDIIRNPGTDFIQTVTTSVMNAKTIPLDRNADVIPESSATKKRAKRPQTTNIEATDTTAGPSRKRLREDDIVEETKKISLEDQVQKMEEGGSIASQLPIIRKPLMNKNCSRDVSRNVTNESNESFSGVNYKRFSKVLPIVKSRLSIDASASGKNEDNNKTGDRLSNTSFELNVKPVPLVKLSYYAGATTYLGNIPPLDPQPQRPATPEGFQPRGFHTSHGARKEKEEEIRKANPGPTTDQDKPSTSGRRTSPRKKGPAIKLPSCMPPSPPPPIQPIQIDDEDDEEDMWSFNQ